MGHKLFSYIMTWYPKTNICFIVAQMIDLNLLTATQLVNNGTEGYELLLFQVT